MNLLDLLNAVDGAKLKVSHFREFPEDEAFKCKGKVSLAPLSGGIVVEALDMDGPLLARLTGNPTGKMTFEGPGMSNDGQKARLRIGLGLRGLGKLVLKLDAVWPNGEAAPRWYCTVPTGLTGLVLKLAGLG
jgi:hypothetical protein